MNTMLYISVSKDLYIDDYQKYFLNKSDEQIQNLNQDTLYMFDNIEEKMLHQIKFLFETSNKNKFFILIIPENHENIERMGNNNMFELELETVVKYNIST